jgi:hypothetical protein
MIDKFQQNSQEEMIKPISRISPPESSGIMHISEAFEEVLYHLEHYDPEKAIHDCLDLINEARWLLSNSPGNQWSVYELCKSVYKLAELEYVDFNGASLIAKLQLIKKLAPFAETKALSLGVVEYHESRSRQNWQMNHLMDPVGEIHDFDAN